MDLLHVPTMREPRRDESGPWALVRDRFPMRFLLVYEGGQVAGVSSPLTPPGEDPKSDVESDG
mgnify:CR=1